MTVGLNQCHFHWTKDVSEKWWQDGLCSFGGWTPLLAIPTAFGRGAGKEALFRSIMCFPFHLGGVSLTIILNSAGHNYSLSTILSRYLFLCKWGVSIGPQGPHILSERCRNAWSVGHWILKPKSLWSLGPGSCFRYSCQLTRDQLACPCPTAVPNLRPSWLGLAPIK